MTLAAFVWTPTYIYLHIHIRNTWFFDVGFILFKLFFVKKKLHHWIWNDSLLSLIYIYYLDPVVRVIDLYCYARTLPLYCYARTLPLYCYARTLPDQERVLMCSYTPYEGGQGRELLCSYPSIQRTCIAVLVYLNERKGKGWGCVWMYNS